VVEARESFHWQYHLSSAADKGKKTRRGEPGRVWFGES
jgi:hypothetical protein